MKPRYIDFHAHILPAADHGCADVDMSLRQLVMAGEAGITTLIATPHFYPHSHNISGFLERRNKAFSAISSVYKGEVKIICAAEVLLCEGLQNLAELGQLRIGDSNTILIEMPGSPWNTRLIESLIHIKEVLGFEVVLAHVERYDPDDIQKLFSLGMLGQLNASAFCGLFLKSRYLSWIDDSFITALGSDIHGLGKAYKEYSIAMKKLGDRGDLLQEAMSCLIKESKIKRGYENAEDLSQFKK